MGLFGSDNQHLGIDIGAHGIKVVQLKKTKGRPQLWTYGMSTDLFDVHEDVVQNIQEKTDPNNINAYIAEKNMMVEERTHEPEVRSAETKDERIARYGEELKALLREAKVTAKKATASLPVSQVFHAAITLPLVDKKELDHHVRAKVKKILPKPIDEMQVVHQLIEDPDGMNAKRKFMQVLVTAAPIELISFYTNVFQYAGIELDELETEAFALERSLVGHEKGTVMIIDVGGERTNFFIVDGGLPITHRSIQIGGDSFDRYLATSLDMSLEDVQQVKGDLSHIPNNSLDTRLFHHLLDPITKEISYHIDMFAKQTGNEGKKVEKIILTGGVSLFPPIISGIRQQFALNVFVGDPWARVVYQQGLKGVLDELGPRMAVCVGLAMRNIV